MPGPAPRPANRVMLTATLVEKKTKRYTPAGLPVMELTFAHESVVQEAGSDRAVRLEFRAKAIGEVAERIERLVLGSVVRLEGFLASARQHSKQLVIHLTNFELE